MNIVSLFKTLEDQHVIFVPNPGNAGDSVITWSTIQMLHAYNIKFEIHDFKDATFQDKIILYGGGGSLYRDYHFAKKFIQKNFKQNKLIVLPQTVYGHVDLLNELDGSVVLFVRERTSYDYVKKYHNNVHLVHDMAFNIRGLDMYKHDNRSGICNAFRLDQEQTNTETPSDNYDITRELSTGFRGVNMLKVCNETNSVASYLSKFSEVNTNRLHVAIVAALIGINVNFYSNCYFKNKAVYDHSIKHKFKNVRWIR